MNVVTISARNGISSIQFLQGDRSLPFRTGIETRDFRIVSGPSVFRCPKTATFLVLVKTQSRQISLRLRVQDCHDNIRYLNYELSDVWNVTQESFGLMRVGERRCKAFSVYSRGGSFVIDSIASPSRDFTIRLTGGRLPLRISGYTEYFYDVCHTARAPGLVRMPILVYLRRDQPAGGLTNFIVADTAVVRVVPAPPPLASRPARPAPKRPTPRVRPVPPPARPDTPAPPPPEIAEVAPRAPRPAELSAPEPPVAGSGGELLLVEIEPALEDPTPYREIVLPNARSIGRGKGFVGVYDVAGVLAGVGLTDRLSAIGGVLYAPTSPTGTVAATVGGKYEWYTEGYLRSAVGLHAAYSRTSTSVVRLMLLYGTASYGDDDGRATVSVGYTLRSHSPVEGERYDRRAAVLAIGGDHRFARHWKIVGEVALLQDAGYQPGGIALRYFGERLAIDVGLALALKVNGGDGAAVLPIPIVTALWTW